MQGCLTNKLNIMATGHLCDHSCVCCRVVCWKFNLNISIIEAEGFICAYFGLNLKEPLVKLSLIYSVKGRQEGKREWNGQIIIQTDQSDFFFFL